MKNTYQEQLDNMLQACYNKLNKDQRKFVASRAESDITFCEANHLYELGVIDNNTVSRVNFLTTFGRELSRFIGIKITEAEREIDKKAQVRISKERDKILSE